ncbi:MAG: AsmA-like C-terminal region-containing protein, partial [Lentisphaeria bacterium]
PGLEYNLADKTGKYNIELERLTPQVAKLLPPRLLATTPVMQLDLRGHTNGTFNLANKQLTANFSSDLKKLQLAVRGYGPTLPVQGSLEGKAQFAKEVLTLRPTELTIDYVDADRLLVHLLANGQLSVPLTQKKNEIFVSSKGIDLQSLGGIVTAYTRREQADKTRKGPEPHDPRQEKQAPPPRKKPAKTIHALAHLDLNDLVFREVTLQSCSGDVLMKDQRISTESLEMEINNASLKITGYLDLSRTPPVYSFDTSLGSLAFSPILRSLGLQAFSSMVNAKTQSLSVKAQGQGFKLSELQQSLAGDAELSMDLLSIKGWDKLAGFARDYNIPELKSLIFNKIHAKAEIADGRILLSDTRMSGKNLKINIEGIIGLDKTLNLSTNLAVGGDLANRLMERGYGAVLKSPTDGYRSLVMPIPINGPWNEPKVDFDVKDFMRETYEENLQDAGMFLLKELMQERDNAEEK